MKIGGYNLKLEEVKYSIRSKWSCYNKIIFCVIKHFIYISIYNNNM